MKIVIQQNPTVEKDIDEISIPDLWHIAMAQGKGKSREMILECWHLCHNLKNKLLELK